MRGDLNSEVQEPRENTGNETVLMRHTVTGLGQEFRPDARESLCPGGVE